MSHFDTTTLAEKPDGYIYDEEECKYLIKEYIKEKKGTEVNNIFVLPHPIHYIQLIQLFEYALAYFKEKINQTSNTNNNLKTK